MKKIIILGSCPLPCDLLEVTHGPGQRTWQFIQPLLQQGYQVLALCLRRQGTFSGAPPVKQEQPRPSLTYYNLAYEAFTQARTLRELSAGHEACVIAGVGSILPVWMASLISQATPLWADFFGDPLSELQAKSSYSSEAEFRHEFLHISKLYNRILNTADRFSAVSNPQRFALIGHLALVGRLSQATAGHDLVEVIPCGVENEGSQPGKSRTMFPPEAFVIYWSGSFNTWSDVDTLIDGLALAMEQEPSLRLLVTGGAMRGYAEQVYQHFEQRLESCSFKDRVVVKGWVPNDEVVQYFREADVGINVDRWVYEAELGSRNRVLTFLQHGLPAVSTVLSELTREAAEQGFILSFAPGDPSALARCLREAVRRRQELAQLGQQAREFVMSKYSFQATLRPFLEWIPNAAKSPDLAVLEAGKGLERITDLDYLEGYVKGLEAEKAAFDSLRRHPLYRFYKTLTHAFKKEKKSSQ